jgi:PAS domain S-box-containing protein
MTRLFRDLSIRAKLIVLIMVISGFILVLAVGSLLLIEIRSERGEVEAEIASLASLIGFHSRAALVFGDQEAAVQTLDALKLKPEVVGAWIQSSQGEIFARYVRKGKSPLPISTTPQSPARSGEPFGEHGAGGLKYRLDDGSLLISQPIILGGEQVGALFLQADLGKLDVRIAAFLSAGAIILLLSGMSAFLLASWLQRFISRPIADLIGVMTRVSRDKDYGLRLKSRSEDEVGQLIASFNVMLAELEQRDRQVEEVKILLEERVRDRTETLDRTNRELLEKIEERRRAETELRIKDKAIASAINGIAIGDAQGRLLFVNQAYLQLWGYESEQEVLGRAAESFWREPAAAQRVIDSLTRTGSWSGDMIAVRKDGKLVDVQIAASLVADEAGRPLNLMASFLDITERKQAEKELRKREANYRALFENSPISLWMEDFSLLPGYFAELRRVGVADFADYFARHPAEVTHCARLTRILDVNQKTLDLFAAGNKEEFFDNLKTIFTESSFFAFRDILVALAEGRTMFETEGINRTLGGEEKHFLIRYSVLPSALKSLDGVIVSLIDITERRETEEALRILGKALETTRVGITIANLQGEIIFTNPAEAGMHGYEIGELLGQKVNILGPPLLRAEFPGSNVQAGERESLNQRKDGRLFPVRLISDLVADAAGQPLAVVTVCEDITERKETEERLKASIAEKEVLLKEVHHRVKNNLQIISSLLNLQMQKITETKTRAELNATRNRIQSMALIHAKLYQSENLSQINFAEYIEDFSRQLRSLYNVSPKRVKLVLDIDAVDLDVDVAIPCGMIVNELLTNALKYAFPGERCGEIRVVLRAEATETVLSVVDNGVGLPPRIDLERVETLGLQLVHGLAQQIRGTVAIDRSGGTRVEIRYPVAGSGKEMSV